MIGLYLYQKLKFTWPGLPGKNPKLRVNDYLCQLAEQPLLIYCYCIPCCCLLFGFVCDSSERQVQS